MNTDFSDLSLMQISDSFFPTGLYTMSNGLETLFSEKRITGMDELCELIQTNIVQQIGPSDCVALSNAYDSTSLNNVEKILNQNNIYTVEDIIRYYPRKYLDRTNIKRKNLQFRFFGAS